MTEFEVTNDEELLTEIADLADSAQTALTYAEAGDWRAAAEALRGSQDSVSLADQCGTKGLS